MLLAGSTRYLSIHEAEGDWLVTAQASHPSKLDIFTCVPAPFSFTRGLPPDKFPIHGLSARTLPGNPIPRTDSRNPLRLNTGREYTSQPYTRNPLSLFRHRCESHRHSYPLGSAPPVEARTPPHSTETSTLYTDIKTPERAKQRAVPSCV